MPKPDLQILASWSNDGEVLVESLIPPGLRTHGQCLAKCVINLDLVCVIRGTQEIINCGGS